MYFTRGFLLLFLLFDDADDDDDDDDDIPILFPTPPPELNRVTSLIVWISLRPLVPVPLRAVTRGVKS